jgi:hypothetical protein
MTIREVTSEEYTSGLLCDGCGIAFNEGEVVVEWMVWDGSLMLHAGCGLSLSGRLYKHIKSSQDKNNRLVLSNKPQPTRRYPMSTHQPTFITNSTEKKVSNR